MMRHPCVDIEHPPPALRLLTLGYAAPGAKEQLVSCMRAYDTLLVDIRLRPVSRWFPAWNRDALIKEWGIRYLWKGNTLGNRHYKQEDRSKGIQLANPDKGIAELACLLEGGYRVILLCACKYAERCHRMLVADLVQAHLPMLTVQHLLCCESTQKAAPAHMQPAQESRSRERLQAPHSSVYHGQACGAFFTIGANDGQKPKHAN